MSATIAPALQALLDALPAENRHVYEATLRESYRMGFALNAPPVPDWYEPEMGRQRPSIPGPPDDLSELAQAMAWDWKRDPQYDLTEAAKANGFPAREVQALREYEAAVEDSRRAGKVYDEERRVRRVAQWPWFYADAVLAERGER